MIGPAGFMAGPKAKDYSQGEVGQIMEGMERATEEWLAHLKAIAPRCHFTPMKLEGWNDESWWECRHCGHTKDAR